MRIQNANPDLGTVLKMGAFTSVLGDPLVSRPAFSF
jgi:hypothetical protein